MTAEQVNKLISISTFEKELASQIEQETGENTENFYNVVSERIKVQSDILAATHKFTKKYAQSQHITESFLHNITVFTELKLSAEDIDNITKHGKTYGLSDKWRLEEIKTLANYKTLKNTFSNNSITLLQYTDWLNGGDYSENKVIEKIAQLTNWNKDTLESIKKITTFKPYFTQNHNPISSLLKIKSIMDIVIRSGINSAVLLELRHLYDSKNDSEWKKYTDAVGNLELSARAEAKDRAIKHLAEQKRDILARYMIYKLQLKNMRNLYSYLLIDVEMSDCSKISPLKAALNSVQLYIHRCMMRLEKGITINQGLNEEKWKWLSSYREWEASNKIKLYPENYLEPTLRSITTPEYKALQSTLMQGNITDEAVNDAYMKYFEDFEQVASLKIVDSCFEKLVDKVSGVEKNTLFIIGRTLARPYIYYYRTAIFDTRNQEILYWTAWKRIEASIPVETVTPIYAFDRLFLFWVQTNEKKEVNITGTGSSKKINPNLPLSDTPEVTINYIFQRPSGSWSAQQELASNVKVNPATEVNKLHWKKVAAFYLTEKGGDERRIVIAIGEIKCKRQDLI
ncbi:MAG: neuraminidase-like domain-containing protein [Wolbachia sp.]